LLGTDARHDLRNDAVLPVLAKAPEFVGAQGARVFDPGDLPTLEDREGEVDIPTADESEVAAEETKPLLGSSIAEFAAGDRVGEAEPGQGPKDA
jgi:hypothetical protein